MGNIWFGWLSLKKLSYKVYLTEDGVPFEVTGSGVGYETPSQILLNYYLSVGIKNYHRKRRKTAAGSHTSPQSSNFILFDLGCVQFPHISPWVPLSRWLANFYCFSDKGEWEKASANIAKAWERITHPSCLDVKFSLTQKRLLDQKNLKILIYDFS